MSLRVTPIVFFFLIGLRFPSNLSRIRLIRNYLNDTVKLLRKFEKLDNKYRKLLLDLRFLKNCIKVTLKFVQFYWAIRYLQD